MRTSQFREPFMPLAGIATIPASVAAAPPLLTDGNEAALCMDVNGNLRVIVLNTTAIPVVSGIGDTLQNAGSAVAPAANGVIVSLAIPGAGVYDVTVLAGYGGTADVVNNMKFENNAVVVGPLYVTPVINGLPSTTRFQRVTVTGAINLTVNAVAAGGAGSVFIASISATRVA